MDPRFRVDDEIFMNKQTQENLLAIVKRNYEDIASEFNETRKKYLWPELVKLAERVKDGDSVLDVGCGNGRLRQAFIDKAINYLGIDNSESLIKFAEENQESRIKNQEFLLGDVLELDKLEIGKFDYIFCIAVLNHIPGKELQIKALEQMKNKLAMDGKIIITNWNLWCKTKYLKIILKLVLLKMIGKNRMDFGDIVFNWKRGEHSQRYYHAFTKCELKKLAKKAGFKIERLYKDKYNYYTVLTIKQ